MVAPSLRKGVLATIGVALVGIAGGRVSLALVAALFPVGMVASASADQCGDLVTAATAAAAKLTRYGTQPEAETTKALALASEARRTVDDAAQACKGTQHDAALEFSAANVAALERALSNAKAERLRDTGVFPPPDEP